MPSFRHLYDAGTIPTSGLVLDINGLVARNDGVRVRAPWGESGNVMIGFFVFSDGSIKTSFGSHYVGGTYRLIIDYTKE